MMPGVMSRAVQQWNTTFKPLLQQLPIVTGDTLSAKDSSYSYDALGRRISDAGTQLIYDASGNVVEEISSFNFIVNTGTIQQYVYSPVVNTLVLRDKVSYIDSIFGPLQRLYAVQDAQQNVTAILGVQSGGGIGPVEERYTYQSTGGVIVLDASSAQRPLRLAEQRVQLAISLPRSPR